MRYFFEILLVFIPFILFAQGDPYWELTHSEIFSSTETARKNTFYCDLDKDGTYGFVYSTNANGRTYIKSLEYRNDLLQEIQLDIPLKGYIKWMEYDSMSNVLYFAEYNSIWKYDPASQDLNLFNQYELSEIRKFTLNNSNGMVFLAVDTDSGLVVLDGDGGQYAKESFGEIDDLKIADIDGDEELEIILSQKSNSKVVNLSTLDEEWSYFPGFGKQIVVEDSDDDGNYEIYGSNLNELKCILGDSQVQIWAKSFSDDINEIRYVQDDSDNPVLLIATYYSIYSMSPTSGDIIWQIESVESFIEGLNYGNIINDETAEIFYVGWKRLNVYNFENGKTWRSNYKDNGAVLELIDKQDNDYIDYLVCSGSSNLTDGGLLEIYNGLDNSRIAEPAFIDGIYDVDQVASIRYQGDLYYAFTMKNGDVFCYKNDFSSSILEYDSNTKIDLFQMFQAVEGGEPYFGGIVNKKKFVMYSFLNGTVQEVWSSINTADQCISYQIGNFDADSNKEVAILYLNYIEIYDLETHELQKQIEVDYYSKHKAFEVGDYFNDGSLDFIIGGNYKSSKTAIQVIDIESESVQSIDILDEEVSLAGMILYNLDTTESSELIILSNDIYICDTKNNDVLVKQYYHDYKGLNFTEIKVGDLDLDKHIDVLFPNNFGYFRYTIRDEFKDVKMPFVRSYYPTEDDKKIPTNTPISILFSEEMDPTSLSNIDIKNSLGQDQDFELEVSDDQKYILLHPVDNWSHNYDIIVKLPNSITDLAGNHLDGNKNGSDDGESDDFSFYFNTGSGIDDIPPQFIALHAEEDVFLNDIFTVFGVLSDKNSKVYTTITDIKYSIDNPNVIEDGIDIMSIDGALDEASENFKLQLKITDLSIGKHTMFFLGRDKAGNWSYLSSLDFRVLDKASINWSFVGKNLFNTSNAFASNVVYPLSVKYSFLDYPSQYKPSLISLDRIISSNDHNIWMRDLKTGDLIWQKEFVDAVHLSVPCFYDNYVYLQVRTEDESALVCLNFKDGSMIWEKDVDALSYSYHGVLATNENIVLVGGKYETNVSAYSAINGDLQWTTKIDNKNNHNWNPAIYNGKVYCFASNFKVLDVTTGEELFHLGSDALPSKLGDDVAFSNPVIDTLNNQVILLNQGYMYAIDLDDYQINWTMDTEDYGLLNTSPALSNNSIFIGNEENLLEIDAAEGSLIWIDNALESEFTPVVTDNIVVFSSDSSTVVLDRKTKNIKGGIKVGGALSIANDYLILSDSDYLYVFEDGEVLNPMSGNIKQTNFIQCNGDSTAIIQVDIDGGNGNLTYNWADIEENESVRENLAAGKYMVTVYDELFNNVSLTKNIKEPKKLELATNAIDATNNQSNGEATVIPSGGTKPYEYHWKDFPDISEPTISNIKAGNYVIEVIDANGCSAITTIVVNLSTNTNDTPFEKEIMIIPTISTGDFQVKVESKWVGSQYSIYNQVGKKVDRGYISGTWNHFETELPSGIYYLSLVKENRTTDVKFLVVR